MNAVVTEITSAPSQLAEFIVAEVHRQTSEEKLRAHVEKKIGEAIEGAVNDAFRSYGSVNKQIADVVQKALDLGGTGLDVPSYGTMVLALLRTKMDATLSDIVNKRLGDEMTEILSIAPKEIKLSTIVEAMVKEASEDMSSRYGSSVTCTVEPAFPDSTILEGYLKVSLDEDDRVKERECEVRLTVNKEGKITDLTLDGYDAKTTIKLGTNWGWKKALFAAYACGSTLIVDEDMCSTGIGDY